MASKRLLSTQQADSLFSALSILSRTVEQVLETHATSAVTTERLSVSKVQILRLLQQRGQQNVSQIAAFLGVSKPAVSQIVDAMVRSKLTVRRGATADRREINVRLTAKGKNLFLALLRRQRHYVRNAARNLTHRGPERWIKTLREITVALAQADRTFQHACLQCGAYEDGTCVLVGGNATCPFLQRDRRSSGRPTISDRKAPARRRAV